MAIFHSTTKIISRSKGRSAVAAAAYRAGEALYNLREERMHNFTKKKGIAYKQIILPPEAPEEFYHREILWNAVEAVEKRKDAQTAREIELALPQELDLSEQIKLLEEYTRTNFVNIGMCVDLAIHDKKDGNPHAHILLTMRSVTPDGFGKKARGWNDRGNVIKWRQAWAYACNEKLKKKTTRQIWTREATKTKGLVKFLPST